MKKAFKILFGVFLAILLLMPVAMYAGDSTTVTTSTTDSIIQTALTWIEAKWSWIGTIGTILFLISELLGSISSIKSNTVYQLVFSWLKKLFGSKVSS